MKITKILEYAPIPDFIKNPLLEQMLSIAHRVLSDKVVLMLVLMILLFNDSSTGHIRDQYYNMLR